MGFWVGFYIVYLCFVLTFDTLLKYSYQAALSKAGFIKCDRKKIYIFRKIKRFIINLVPVYGITLIFIGFSILAEDKTKCKLFESLEKQGRIKKEESGE